MFPAAPGTGASGARERGAIRAETGYRDLLDGACALDRIAGRGPGGPGPQLELPTCHERRSDATQAL